MSEQTPGAPEPADNAPATEPAEAPSPAEPADAAEPAAAPDEGIPPEIPAEPLLDMTCPACQALVDLTGVAPFSEIKCEACGATIRVPAKFAHFMLLKRLGAGGMGATFLGEDEALGRKVAIKVMQGFEGADPKAFETFRNEAQSAARLNHPHVAQVYSFGQEKGSPYLEMELVPGGDLGKFIADGVKLDPAFVIRVGEEIAEGLKAAEEGGLFHGDVKPDNILFDENMSAKLVDFGIASRSSQGASDELWGTPYYIAPEKVQQKKNSARSDIYSLGATLYHAIAGQPPYDGEDAVAVIKARFNGPPKPIDQVRPDIEPEVARIIARMMYNDLFMRYPNYNSLIGDMKKYLSGVSAIRKQGPKAASAAVRKSATGVVETEAPASATQRSGKKKFVITKGQMEAAEARKEMDAASSAVTEKKSGKIRIKGLSSSLAAAAASEGGAGGDGETPGGEAKPEEKKGGGGAKATLIAMVVGFLLVLGAGVGYFLYSRAQEKKEARRVESNRREAVELAETCVKLDAEYEAKLVEIRDIERAMRKQIGNVSATYEKATGRELEIPDLDPDSANVAAAIGHAPAETEAEQAAVADAAIKNNENSGVALVTAEQAAEDAEKAKAAEEAKPKKKPRKSAVIQLAEWYVESGTAPDVASATDMINAEARKAGKSSEEYSKEELGDALEDDGSGGDDEAADAGGGGDAQAAAPAAADEDEPAVKEHPLDARVEALVWTPARAIAMALRCAEALRPEAEGGAVFEPLPPSAAPNRIDKELKERKELLKKREERKERLQGFADDAARANIAFRKGCKDLDRESKQYVNERERLAKEAEEKRLREEAEEKARIEAEELAVREAGEVARVKETAAKHLPMIQKFDYTGFIDKMSIMNTGTKNSTVSRSELTTAGAKEEVAWTIRRVEKMKEMQDWILEDLRRVGGLEKGYLWKGQRDRKGKIPTMAIRVEGVSENKRTLILAASSGKPDVLVKNLQADDWLRLFKLLVEKRADTDRKKLTPPEHGDLCMGMAIFYWLHYQGTDNEAIAMENAMKLAKEAIEEKTALQKDAVHWFPPLENALEEEGSGEASE